MPLTHGIGQFGNYWRGNQNEPCDYLSNYIITIKFLLLLLIINDILLYKKTPPQLPIGAMEIHWATCSTTKRDIVKVEESSDIVKDRKREAERLEKKFNEIEPRRNALMQEHGALLKKWEEIEKTSVFNLFFSQMFSNMFFSPIIMFFYTIPQKNLQVNPFFYFFHGMLNY